MLCKIKNLPYLYFDTGCRKNSHILEDTYQQIFLAKFLENLTLPGGLDSIFELADSLPLKLIQLPLVRSGFRETLRGVYLLVIFSSVKRAFVMYCQDNVWWIVIFYKADWTPGLKGGGGFTRF